MLTSNPRLRGWGCGDLQGKSRGGNLGSGGLEEQEADVTVVDNEVIEKGKVTQWGFPAGPLRPGVQSFPSLQSLQNTKCFPPLLMSIHKPFN